MSIDQNFTLKPDIVNTCDEFSKQANLTVSRSNETSRRRRTRFKSSCRPTNCDQYICDTCNKSFASEIKLKLHIFLHMGKLQSCETVGQSFTLGGKITHTDKEHICTICVRGFRSSRDLSTHMFAHTRDTEEESSDQTTPGSCDQYTCCNCNKTFAKLSEKHMTFHKDKHYSCDTCVRSFILATDLRNHKRIHIGEKLYKCEVCEKTFTRSTNLARHMPIHSGDRPYECKMCQKHFTQLWILKRHSLIHNGAKPYICGKCGNSYAQQSYLKYHMLHKHTDAKSNMYIPKPANCEKRYKCERCEKRFRSSSHLSAHKRTHSGDRPFECKTCQKTFTQHCNLKRHSLIHTGAKPYICGKCGNSYAQQSYLKYHILYIHTEGKSNIYSQKDSNYEKRYKCERCEKRFRTSSHLSAHKRTHTGDRPYKCKQCTQSFTQPCNLKRHMSIHIGVKPYNCETCGNAFRQLSTLQEHRLIHSDEKRYICKHCEKSFTQKTGLQTHLRSHSKERPYVCSYCVNKAFSSLSSLKKHERVIHGRKK